MFEYYDYDIDLVIPDQYRNQIEEIPQDPDMEKDDNTVVKERKEGSCKKEACKKETQDNKKSKKGNSKGNHKDGLHKD